MDFKTPNLAGANEAFNSFATKLESIKDNMLSGLEAEASTLASTLSTELTELTTTLRDMMPSVPTIPDVNLQSKLTSLAGLLQALINIIVYLVMLRQVLEAH